MPTTYKQAIAALDVESWQSAILEAYQAIPDAETSTVHDIFDLHPNRQPVDSKCLDKVTNITDRLVELYEARMVAEGYCQIEGLGYDNTFATVTL